MVAVALGWCFIMNGGSGVHELKKSFSRLIERLPF
jgi:hypothetical protein